MPATKNELEDFDKRFQEKYGRGPLDIQTQESKALNIKSTTPVQPSTSATATKTELDNFDKKFREKYGRNPLNIQTTESRRIQTPYTTHLDNLTQAGAASLPNSSQERIVPGQDIRLKPLQEQYDTASRRLDVLNRHKQDLQNRSVLMNPQEYKRQLDETERQIEQMKSLQGGAANQLYYENNQEQLDRIQNSTTAAIYEAGRNAKKDQQTILQLMAPNAQNQPEYTEAVQKISEAYGVSPQTSGTDYQQRLQELYNQLEDTRKKSRRSVNAAGFDYDRLEEYEERIQADAENAKARENVRTFAKEHPVAASALSVAVQPAAGLDYLQQVIGNLGRNDAGNLDTYRPMSADSMTISNFVSDIRGSVSEEIEKNTDWDLFGKNIASFLYQTGMSVADTLFLARALGGSGASFLLGMSASAQQTSDALSRGANSRQALLAGFAAGAAEMLFEKFSIDQLLKPKSVTSVKRLLQETMKQAGVEASEEGATEIANILTDAAIMGESSNFSVAVENYKAQGMSESEAKKQAYLDMIGQVGWAAAGGALSGGVMGGVVNTARFGPERRAAKAVKSETDRLNETAQDIDEDIRPERQDPAAQTPESVEAYQQEISKAMDQQEQRLRQQAQQASQEVNGQAQQQTEQPNVTNTNSTSGLVWAGSDLDRRTRLAATLPREQATQFLQDAENGDIESAYQNAAADIQTPQTTRAANPGLIRDDSFRRAHYDARTERTLDTLAKAAGVSVRIVDKIPAYDADGNPIGMANARYHNGAIEIARNAKNPAGVAFTHEIVHRVRQADPEAYRAMARLVIDSLSDERYSGALDSRAQKYRDLDESNMQEELVADAFGRVLGDSEYLDRIVRQNRTVWQRILDTIRDFIDRIRHVSSIGLNESERQEFSELAGRAEKMASLLENALDRAETAQRIQTENAAQEDGVERYSINPAFSTDIQEWYEDGQPEGERFVLGSTGPVLQGLGALESDIYINGDKVSTILQQHPEMTIREIQRIPEILEDPVLVLKSKGTGKRGSNSRLVLFGSIKAQNGQPVMSVLDLRPTENGFLLDDMQKVNSTYTKKNPDRFVSDSEVLYADEKRTIPLLRHFGLTIASRELLRKGSMGSISYGGKNVNISDMPLSSVVELNRDNPDQTSVPDTRYSLMSSEISDMSNRLTEQLQAVNARADAGEITQEEATAQKMAILQAPIRDLIAQYGQMEPGERPFRDITIPRKTGENMRVSRTARTALEAEATPDELVPDIEKLVAEGEFSYEAYGDEQAKKDAEQRIQEIKFDAAKTEWERSIHKGRSSKFNTALGWTLYNEAANSGKTETAIQILTEMVGYQRDHAQALQAARILKQLSPDAQLYSATKAASDIQRDLDERHSRGNQYKLREESETAKRVGEAIQGARSDAAKALRNGDETFEQSIEKELNRLFRRRKDKDAQTEVAKKDIAWKVSEIVSDRNARKSARDAVISMLIEKYGVSEADAAAAAQIVGERFDTLVQESMQKRLDSIFKERQKPKRRTVQQRFEELASLGAFSSEQYNEMAVRRIIGDVPGIRIDPVMAEEFLAARTQNERDAIMKRIYMDIGRQMPSNFLDKWNAWRYFAMLANPRTHIRNIAGNTFFVPVVAAKNLTATAIENAVHFVSGGRTERGKAFVGASKSDLALLGAAWNDFSKVEDVISGVGKYEDSVSVQRAIQEGRRIFQSNKRLLSLIARPMEAARRGAGNLLTLEDMWFSKPHYAYALAQYCKAHGITEADIRAGNGLDAARAYAIKEAQKATYRDANMLSQAISGLGRYHGENPVLRAGSMLMDGILPFRSTPANILVRGLEYSPAGLLNGIKQVLWDVRRGNMTATQAIDSISAGLTGSGLLALGLWMAAQGLIRGHGSDDEEEEAFLEMLGHQQYALEIGGNSYTLDWLAPEALPLFMGVNAYETMQQNGEFNMADLIGVLTRIGEPMMQMSFLQSFNDAFDAVKYAANRNMEESVAALADAATSYLMQGFPSFLGQIERASQADRMTTYTNPNAFLTTDMQYTLGSISARVPGVDYQQIPYIDAWGRKETEDSTAIRVRDNMFNPSYTDSYGATDLEAELLRLYDAVGSSAVFPERADKSFKVNGENLYLDADQYVKYATEKGKGALELATKIYESAEYKLLDDETKVEVISDAYAYANAIAKTKVSEYEPDGWVANALESGMKPEDYIIANARLDNMSSFNAMIESGIDSETAFTVAQAISSLEPEKGEETVSSMQKYKAVLHENLEEAEKVEALEYLMPNGTAEKFSTAVSYGITSEQYVDYMEHADANGNSSVTQKEAQNMISSISGLSQQQRAVLWQLQNKSWKSENNPFGYSGIQQEPESGGLTLGGGGSTTERTTQSTNFGQLILGGNRR
nr:MAG TPA: hypothetical protein [Bacteriophage sp.]